MKPHDWYGPHGKSGSIPSQLEYIRGLLSTGVENPDDLPLPRLAYIAGPLAAGRNTQADNIKNAMMLGRQVARAGWVPVVPHLLVEPIYPEDTDRTGGLFASLQLMEMVARAKGRLVVLTSLKLNGATDSMGTMQEVSRWRTIATSPPVFILEEMLTGDCPLCGSARHIPCHNHAIGFAMHHEIMGGAPQMGQRISMCAVCKRRPAIVACPVCNEGEWPIPLTRTERDRHGR